MSGSRIAVRLTTDRAEFAQLELRSRQARYYAIHERSVPMSYALLISLACIQAPAANTETPACELVAAVDAAAADALLDLNSQLVRGRDTQRYVDHWGRPAMRVTYRPTAYHFPVPYGAGYPYPHVGFVPTGCSTRYRAIYYPGPPERRGRR